MRKVMAFILSVGVAYGAEEDKFAIAPQEFTERCAATKAGCITDILDFVKIAEFYQKIYKDKPGKKPEDMKAAQEEAEKYLVELKAGRVVPMPQLDYTKIKMGSWGALKRPFRAGLSATVLQVTGPSSLIVKVCYQNSSDEKDDILLWIDALNTTGVVDGASLSNLKVVFMVKGTKSYETSVGMKTIYRLEPVDVSALVEEIKTQAAAAQAEETKRLEKEQAAMRERLDARAKAEAVLQEEQRKKAALEEAERIRRMPMYILKDGRQIRGMGVEDMGRGRLIVTDETGRAHAIPEADIARIEQPKP